MGSPVKRASLLLRALLSLCHAHICAAAMHGHASRSNAVERNLTWKVVAVIDRRERPNGLLVAQLF